jgi:hypothetical protein
MDSLVEHLPQIITAAAQSPLGILALLSVALAVLAYFFFATASEKIKVGIFVLLFLGVAGFAAALFRAAPTPADASHGASATPAPDPLASLSDEARLLLREAAADPAGIVQFAHYGTGSELLANDRNLLPPDSRTDPRVLATWQAALKSLVDGGWLAARGTAGEIFEVTRQGYDAANRLPNGRRPE